MRECVCLLKATARSSGWGLCTCFGPGPRSYDLTMWTQRGTRPTCGCASLTRFALIPPHGHVRACAHAYLFLMRRSDNFPRLCMRSLVSIHTHVCMRTHTRMLAHAHTHACARTHAMLCPWPRGLQEALLSGALSNSQAMLASLTGGTPMTLREGQCVCVGVYVCSVCVCAHADTCSCCLAPCV